jgi:hypothetical protein
MELSLHSLPDIFGALRSLNAPHMHFIRLSEPSRLTRPILFFCSTKKILKSQQHPGILTI